MSAQLVGPRHYRICDSLYGSRVVAVVEAFDVVKETKQGYWVAANYSPAWMDFAELRRKHYLHWVSKTSHKRHCYPDLADAVRSFNRRKEVQVSKLRFQLDRAEIAAKGADVLAAAQLEQLVKGVELGNLDGFSDLGEW